MYNEILIYIRKHIRAISQDINSVEDIAQDVFLDYSKCKDEIKKPRAYLYRVATSKIIDWKKDQEKHAATTQIDVPTPVEKDHDPLYRAISLLSRIEQEAIKAVYFEGLSAIDAAGKLGLNYNTLKSRLDRGREKIKLTLQHHSV